MNFRLLLAVTLVWGTVPAVAQDNSDPISIRLRVEEDVRVGRQAPQVVLPYATSQGAGPADQPFDLRKELGHVVVLAFYPGDFTPGCLAEWRALSDRAGTLFGPGVVLAGISVDPIESHVRFARELELPARFKLLSDTGLSVTRRYGLASGDVARRAVVVIGRDGIVRYFDPAFAALDPASYNHLEAAIDQAAGER